MKVLLLLLATGLSWTACSHAAPAPQSRTPEACSTEVRRAEVLLRVLDARGRPLSGARVSLNPVVPGTPSPPERVDGLMTDAAGEVRLTPRLDPGQSPFVVITAEGYRPLHWTLELLPGERRRVDVKPRPSVPVSGRVVDTRGQPVPGAEVVGRGDSDYGQTRTDAEGRFLLPELAPGPVALTVSLQGQALVSEQVVAPRADVELSWKASALGVQVRDERGQPLPGAQVRVQSLPEVATPVWVDLPATDAEGKTESGLLRPGPARVLAHWKREGFSWVTSREVSLADGQRHTVVLAFEGIRVRPPVTGRVTDEKGRPVPGADVVATPLTSPDPGSLVALFQSESMSEQSHTLSDAQGRFTLKGLREGAVRVRAAKRGESLDEAAPVEAPPGRDEVSLVMPRKSTLQGTVVDPEGKPVEDLFIWVGDEGAPVHFGRLEDLVVPAGRSLITLAAEGFAAERRTIEVPARSAFRFKEPIVLQPERTVRGRVVKEDGCTPMPDAVVMVDREAPPERDMDSPLSTRTDPEGRFTLPMLKREPLVLRVTQASIFPWGPRGDEPVVRQPVAADEDSVTVRFVPEASVSGVVTDGEGRPLSGGMIGTSCTPLYKPIDAQGRYVVHGLEGGKACLLSVDTRQATGSSEAVLVFTPKRVVLPTRGMLRVDLAARRGPASLKVRLPHREGAAVLLEGDVPMPETWRQHLQQTEGALRSDPGVSLDIPWNAPVEVSFSQLSPGRYTLFAIRLQRGGSHVALVRVPVTLDGPEAKRVEVDFAGARGFKTD